MNAMISEKYYKASERIVDLEFQLMRSKEQIAQVVNEMFALEK